MSLSISCRRRERHGGKTTSSCPTPHNPPTRTKSPVARNPAHPKIPPRLYSKEEASSSPGPSAQDNNTNRNSSPPSIPPTKDELIFFAPTVNCRESRESQSNCQQTYRFLSWVSPRTNPSSNSNLKTTIIGGRRQ